MPRASRPCRRAASIGAGIRRATPHSASPTTAPTSAAGAANRDCARCRACSRRRSRRCSAAPASRRGSPSPGAPTPACTHSARWRTSTSARRARRGRRGPDEGTPPTSTPEAVLARRLTGIIGADADVVVDRRRARSRGIRRPVLGGLAPLRVPRRRRLAPARPARAATAPSWCRARSTSTAMDAAARSLVGLHDFAAFCRPRDGATTIRTLQAYRWRRRRRRRARGVAAGRRVLPLDGARARRRVRRGGRGPARRSTRPRACCARASARAPSR